MDSTAIIVRVSKAKSYCDLADLIRDLEPVDPHLLFETLFPIAIKRQGGESGPVAMSAYALHALNPPFSMKLDHAIARLLNQEWDISIEEVPWYLTNQFGADEFIRHLDNALERDLGEVDRVRLTTLRYWVGQNPSPRNKRMNR